MKITNTSLILGFTARSLVCIALLAALTSCKGYDDPFQRPGTWRTENVNDANIAAMAVDKHQLVMGINDPASPGVLSAEAVKRLLTDHVKPLPSTEIGPVSAATPSSGGGTP